MMILPNNLNIFSKTMRVFLSSGKNAYSAFACVVLGAGIVWRQSELCVFRCAAPAAHFLFFMNIFRGFGFSFHIGSFYVN